MERDSFKKKLINLKNNLLNQNNNSSKKGKIYKKMNKNYH